MSIPTQTKCVQEADDKATIRLPLTLSKGGHAVVQAGVEAFRNMKPTNHMPLQSFSRMQQRLHKMMLLGLVTSPDMQILTGH